LARTEPEMPDNDNEVINSEASMKTASVVGMVLLCSVRIRAGPSWISTVLN